MVIYGQVVVGPPGSGKSTYCQGMKMFMNALGRKCEIINLDFANEDLPYKTKTEERPRGSKGNDVLIGDVRDLITLEDAMEQHSLGPNGGLIYCMETLLANAGWLEELILSLQSHYVLFDCPGQVELYTHYSVVQDLFRRLQKSEELDLRLCSVHLIDAFYCSQPATFISAVLLVTSTMLRLGLPHVSVLSKIDLLSMYGPMPFNLDFFTEMPELSRLVRYIGSEIEDTSKTVLLNEQEEESSESEEIDDEYDDNNNAEEDSGDGSVAAKSVKSTGKIHVDAHCTPLGLPDSTKLQSTSHKKAQFPLKTHTKTESKTKTKQQRPSRPSIHLEKFRKLSEGLCEVLEDYGIVRFTALNIQDAETVGRVLAEADRANGYSIAAEQFEMKRRFTAKSGVQNNNCNNSNSGSSSGGNSRTGGAGGGSRMDRFRTKKPSTSSSSLPSSLSTSVAAEASASAGGTTRGGIGSSSPAMQQSAVRGQTTAHTFEDSLYRDVGVRNSGSSGSSSGIGSGIGSGVGGIGVGSAEERALRERQRELNAMFAIAGSNLETVHTRSLAIQEKYYK